ncbi:hypothetical protein [Polaromonas sp.]|uniref:hypothetical protein n=1 Tax=Polaromonas sp. TaxID=1869339 RepID=UPI00248A74C0|nr:hypothetical protein [Polaromonas sp.]MDI1273318.1 hypothetical protein [Polaromonas sp.]
MEVSLFEVNKCGYRTANLPSRTRGDNKSKRHFQKNTTGVGWGQQTFQLWKKDYKKKQPASLYSRVLRKFLIDAADFGRHETCRQAPCQKNKKPDAP